MRVVMGKYILVLISILLGDITIQPKRKYVLLIEVTS